MNGEKLKIAGLAKTVLTSADGRLKEIIYMGNQATQTVKIHTIQRIILDSGLTQAVAVHLYDSQQGGEGNDVVRFTIASIGTGVTGSSATGAVSGQTTLDSNLSIRAIALHTAGVNNTNPASSGYASVTANINLSAGDVFGVTWCLTVS